MIGFAGLKLILGYKIAGNKIDNGLEDQAKDLQGPTLENLGVS